MVIHWEAQLEGLLALGYKREPAATAHFVSSVEGPDLCGYGMLLATAVAALPDSCRVLAEPILASARACGASDEAICAAIARANGPVLERHAAAPAPPAQDPEEQLRKQCEAWGQFVNEYPGYALAGSGFSVGRSGTNP